VEDDCVGLGLMRPYSNWFYGGNLCRYLEKHCEERRIIIKTILMNFLDYEREEIFYGWRSSSEI